ncbi:PA2169 family four-helix-bundle protein [Luteolibacter yonseiensis]|uniref:PA2169 family four-helix-bundle protein n=1 Tax=Luteolibacter yonseiensis TaxID=1144680 RepID=A0A934R5J2_9BACT|nr:PA2169 family four-helix-bundle protein [Luteolibacter yonseiensis]MBK1817586.1 PA2169 family four-helix-bundle protein [Luteolibacter yonseiensis]
MLTLEDRPVKDAAELQHVLTRYIDSYHGYQQAAAVVSSPSFAEAFLEIADRRQLIVRHVSTLILNQGEKVDSESSPEATLHRWWMLARALMTDDELKAVLAECVRGEKELSRTIHDVLTHGNLDANHAAIITDVATELEEAIRTFESVLNP